MGVPGLQSFVERLGLGNRVNLRTEAAQETIVIALDGNSWIYQLFHENHLDWLHGGQYAELAAAAGAFVERLQAAGVGLRVYFDGALDAAKLDTTLSRRSADVETANAAWAEIRRRRRPPSSPMLLPPLAQRCVYERLRGLGVLVEQAPYEADSAIAAACVAHRLWGVLSRDSDFLVYGGVSRYLLLHTVEFRTRGPALADDVFVQVIEPAQTAAALGIEPQWLPVFAALVGTDASSGAASRRLLGQLHERLATGAARGSSPIRNVAKLVARLGADGRQPADASLGGLVNSRAPPEQASQLGGLVRDALERYDNPMRHGAAAAPGSSLQQPADRLLEPALLTVLSRGEFWCRPLLAADSPSDSPSDSRCGNAFDACAPLRQRLYAMTLAPDRPHGSSSSDGGVLTVTEYVQRDGRYRRTLTRLTLQQSVASSAQLASAPQQERQAALLAACSCEDGKQQLQPVPPELEPDLLLRCIALRYMYVI
eukprot:TRINITY_DN1390_c0_g1_i2.p1 TRINITY_DN1390_c0_g1~~TRINITY_DN1390_c0_g1_i2.p1  ORF type:complete len:484 (-),score=162.19 TRINITY_DN1390_c0_g1_i2:124-1575(-)